LPFPRRLHHMLAFCLLAASSRPIMNDRSDTALVSVSRFRRPTRG
jgi:hypothetical protein